MKAPRIHEYEDDLGALPVYKTRNEDGQEIFTILKPEEGDGEKILKTITLHEFVDRADRGEWDGPKLEDQALDILNEIRCMAY